VEGSSYGLISGTTLAFVEGMRKPQKAQGGQLVSGPIYCMNVGTPKHNAELQFTVLNFESHPKFTTILQRYNSLLTTNN